MTPELIAHLNRIAHAAQHTGSTRIVPMQSHGINGGQTAIPPHVAFIPLWGGSYHYSSNDISAFNAGRATFAARNPHVPAGVYYTTFQPVGGGSYSVNPPWLELTKKSNGSYEITRVGITPSPF